MDDGFGPGIAFGIVLGAIATTLFLAAIFGDDVSVTFQTACESILGADYVQELSACVEDDEIVHRFEKED